MRETFWFRHRNIVRSTRLEQIIGSRLIALCLISLAMVAGTYSVVLAQGTDTVYDEAGVLTDSQEQEVQVAFDSAQEEAGQPIYAFLVPDTGVNTTQARKDLLKREASEADVPQDAGVIMVAPKDRWDVAANMNGISEDAVSNAMEPDFRNGDFASGLIAGADEIRGEPVAAQGNPEDGAGVLPGGGLLLLLLAGTAALALLRNRRASKRRIEVERRTAEEEFAGLTAHLNEFDEKERLVSGYLEAQRPLLDRRAEELVEAKISEARTAGFAQEFNEAASRLTSDPVSARERIARGRNLLEESMQRLYEAEKAMDDYRAADEALEGRLRAAMEEIRAAEEAEERARSEGVCVEHQELRPEYDRLAREAADRASRRDEFDPRQSLAAVEALAERAREQRTAQEQEIAARDALPDERYATEGALGRARETLTEYRGAHETALGQFGQAALGEVPAPGELSSDLLEAEGDVDRSDRASSAGRFAEARSLLKEAADIARRSMQAPSLLKAATAEADRKRREGEEKLKELEARLAQAKANEHLMDPYQRQRLRDYEYQLGNARYGFFGGDWLTALLLFEALDNDYMYMGDPSSFSGGDWGGGDWGGGDFGGGDWGGGDFGGGDF
ncbi:MAG TPA: TPM domain-containing protein [Rubrobacter sp.]